MKEFERQKLEIKKELAGARSRIHTTPHFWLYLPNAEMALDLEANEVEVKVLTSLASVAEVTELMLQTMIDTVLLSHTRSSQRWRSVPHSLVGRRKDGK